MATQETEKPVKSDTPKMTSPPTKSRVSTPSVEADATSSQDMPIPTPASDVRLVTGQMAAVSKEVTPDDNTVFVPDPSIYYAMVSWADCKEKEDQILFLRAQQLVLEVKRFFKSLILLGN